MPSSSPQSVLRGRACASPFPDGVGCGRRDACGARWIDNGGMPTSREVAAGAVELVDRSLSAATPSLRRTVGRLAGADPGSRSIALRALGHALMAGGSVDEARTTLRSAIRLAERSGESEVLAAAQLKMAHAELLSGRLKRALQLANSVLMARAPTDRDRIRAYSTRALILRERGQFQSALTDLDKAVNGLRLIEDELGLQRALVNRALVHIDMFAVSGANDDLREAEALAIRAGGWTARGLIIANLGYAASQVGDVPEALDRYAQAEAIFHDTGAQLAGILMDRSELLARVGLADDARADAEAALREAQRERRTLRIPEVRLLLARAASACGEPLLAHDQARRAQDTFGRQGRATWAAAAGFERARATRASGGHVLWKSVARHADALASARWWELAVEAYLLVAAVAPEPQRTDALKTLAARRGRGPALLRARGWYAQALLLHDRPQAARRAVRRGLAVLDDHLAGVGADELRAGLARHRLALAGLGVDLALAGKQPTAIFNAVERARATVLVRDAVRPPPDVELAELLTQHRAARTERARTALAGRIRDRTRSARGAGELLHTVRMSAVDDALGDAAMLVWFIRDGRLHALTRVSGRTRLHHLGAEPPVRVNVDRLSFAAHRLAIDGSDSGRFDTALHHLLRTTTAELQTALLTPLAEAHGRELVLIPPAFLHQLPWHELPDLTGRPLSVASSVRQWCRAATGAAQPPARPLVAAGPGLPGARREAQTVAAAYGVEPLLDPDARVQPMLDELARADLAHLATHGRLRPDNPQFSELTMSDGPLLVHHLDVIDRLPPTLILASCDSGRPVSRPGEALLGFAAACLIRGTRTLIAPVAPVPDGSTETVMTRLHAELAAGQPPASALAKAQSDQSPGRRVFVCFGAGFAAPASLSSG